MENKTAFGQDQKVELKPLIKTGSHWQYLSDIFLLERYVIDLNAAAVKLMLSSNAGSSTARLSSLIFASAVTEGDFLKQLLSCKGVTSWIDHEYQSVDEFKEKVKNVYLEDLNGGDMTEEDKAWKCSEVQWIGVNALYLFMQLNFTGPDISVEELNINEKKKYESLYRMTEMANIFLSSNGEIPYERSILPILLFFSKCLFELLELCQFHYLSTLSWWLARSCLISGRILHYPEQAPHLWLEFDRYFLKTCENFESIDDSENENISHLSARMWIEFGLGQHFFDKKDKGKEYFYTAQKMSGLQTYLSGALGKRTKYQEKSFAQLILVAESSLKEKMTNSAQSNIDYEKEGIDTLNVGHDFENHLLDKISFTEESVEKSPNLSEVDLCTILALCLDISNSNPHDGLTNEQMSPYIERVLRQPSNWMIYSTALLQRALIEFERQNSAERSVLQLQTLLDQHTTKLTVTQASIQSIETSAKVADRVRWIFTLIYPPQWELKRCLAQRYSKIGVLKSAAELYEELGLWDEAVDCYNAMQLTSIAQKIINERLNIEPTPRLLCALGEIKNDDTYFEKAWILSGKRMARAKVGLAKCSIHNGDCETAVYHLKDVVRINSSMTNAWFTMGVLLMRMERWQEALAAFLQVVTQSPDEGEAWGNCGAIHLKVEAWEQANESLSQALKYSRNNWRLWDNKMTALIHLKKWNEAVQALHKILDLKHGDDKSVDIAVLSLITDAAIESSLGRGESSNDSELVINVARLLGRITATFKSDPDIWNIYAIFNDKLGRGVEKVADCRLKQCRALLAEGGWEKDEHRIQRVYEASQLLVDAYNKVGTKAAKYQAKMHLKSCCKKIETAADFINFDGYKKFCSLLNVEENDEI